MMGATSINQEPFLNQDQAASQGVSQVRNFQQLSLLESVLNLYADGIVVLTKAGKRIYQNETAFRILKPFSSDGRIPESLWKICQDFIETADASLNDEAIEETELQLESIPLRVRVRWIVLDQVESPCLLVMLIDSTQAETNLAITEAKQFGLTPSETKVFRLYRANYSYSEIAKELFISINTVKKHMKNIHRKRKDGLDDD